MFLPTLPPLTSAEAQQLKDQLASSGFDIEVAAILSKLNLTPDDQTVLSQILSQTAVSNWPTPANALTGINRRNEIFSDITALLPQLRIYLPVVRRN